MMHEQAWQEVQRLVALACVCLALLTMHRVQSSSTSLTMDLHHLQLTDLTGASGENFADP